jgi:acyl-CoA reductase-like NAD-dependent aldehyde dehydrogenase
VPPTFPLLVGGRLRRAEAGRGRPVRDAAGDVVAVATTASAADLSEAVAAARAALPGWSGASAYERGRILYAVADLLDRADGPPDEIGPAADRWLWYAGWTDKIAHVLGAVRPADGPYTGWSAPRPVGVVGVLAPTSLHGLVDVLAPVLAAGATAVVVAPHEQPLAAAELAEVLAASELPAGVANVLTGDVAGLAPELVAAGVDGLDPAGVPAELAEELRWTAAEHGIRVPRRADDGLGRLRAWTEVTTVWHPAGR